MHMETKGIPCRVLVVDDHGDTAESFRVILNLWVMTFGLRRAARTPVSITTDYRPSIVFLDLGLPGLNGYDVACALNQLPHRPFIAVVSGYGTQEDRRRSAEAGADIHFAKPADFMGIDIYSKRSQAIISLAAFRYEESVRFQREGICDSRLHVRDRSARERRFLPCVVAENRTRKHVSPRQSIGSLFPVVLRHYLGILKNQFPVA